MNEIKNIICLTAAFLLAAGFSSCGSEEDASTKNTQQNSSASVTQEKSDSSMDESSSAADIVTEITSVTTSYEGVPELTCPKIEFEDGSTLFANSDNGYTLINSKHEEIFFVRIVDDENREIIIQCTDGELSFLYNGSSIDSFTLKGYPVELLDGKLYYNKSLVEYEDTAFSSYKLSDEFTLKCTAASRYILEDSNGFSVNMGEIVDDNGLKLSIVAGRTGFEATNSNGQIEPTFKINGDLINISNGSVYINGEALVPPGYNDISVAEKKVTSKKETSSKTTKEDDSKSTQNSGESPSSQTQTQSNASTNGQTQQTASPVTTKTEVKSTIKTTTTAKTTTISTTKTAAKTAAQTSAKTTTTKKAATTTAKVKSNNVSDLTNEMLGYVNEVRKQYGLSEVYGLQSLDNVSAVRVKELLTSYSHSRPDGKSYSSALDDAGIEWYHCAENIGYGSPNMTTAKEIFDAWMNSPDHRANILNPKMKYMSVSKTSIDVDGQKKTFWEQIFFNDNYIAD